MRLGKDDFKKLLNEPMLDWVTTAEAEEIIRTGGQWLDVRLPSEYRKSAPRRRDQYSALLHTPKDQYSRSKQEVRPVVVTPDAAVQQALTFLVSAATRPTC